MVLLEIRYAVNVVSLMHIGHQPDRFPGCFFALPEVLIEEALAAGYDGVQMLPIRGSTGNEDGVLLFEDAWNAVPSLWHALRHYPGAAGLPSCINDWVVSPTPMECEQVVSAMQHRDLPQVVHQFDGRIGHLVEVHPGLDMTPEQIIEKCGQTGQRLVLDLEHLYRNYREYEVEVKPSRAGKLSPLGTGTRAAALLSPLVDVIHVKPLYHSIDEFLGREFFPLDSEKLPVDYVLHNSSADFVTVVTEYAPTKGMLLSPRKSRDVAARMFETMHRLIES